MVFTTLAIHCVLASLQAQQTSSSESATEEAIAAVERSMSYRIRASTDANVSPEFHEENLTQFIVEGKLKTEEMNEFKAGVCAGYMGISEPRSYRLTLDGEKIRLDAQHRDKLNNPVPYSYAFNGKQAKYLIPEDNRGFIQGNAAMRYGLLLREPTRLGKLLFPEYTEAQRDELKEAIREGTCLKNDHFIDLDYDDPWQPYLRKIRLDMNQGGLVVWSQTRHLIGELFSESRIEKARQTSDGDWIVLKYSETDYMGPRGKERPYFTMTHEFNNFVERTNIPDTEFDIVFPLGCIVHDETTGITTSEEGAWPKDASESKADADEGNEINPEEKALITGQEPRNPKQANIMSHTTSDKPEPRMAVSVAHPRMMLIAVAMLVVISIVLIRCRYRNGKQPSNG